LLPALLATTRNKKKHCGNLRPPHPLMASKPAE
jgi:hypothetical protein